MGHEKAGLGPDALRPIPTYDEAMSSRPSSSQSHLGPAEVSADAERQGLLHDTSTAPSTRRHGYRPPTVESARSSVDLDLLSDDGHRSARNSADALRREIAEMDVADPPAPGRGARLSKRIGSLRLGALRLPAWPRWLPSLSSIRSRLAELPNPFRPANGILLLRAVALLFVLTFGYLVFFTHVFRRREGRSFNISEVQAWVQGNINATRLMTNLEHLTKWDHMAGTKGSFFLAQWLEEEMVAAGVDRAARERFDVYLNYPRRGGRKVAIVEPPEKRWEARLEEDKVYADREQTMVFHGYSKSGNVKGPLVYANYGSREDFEELKKKAVKVDGAIVLVRYYGSQTDLSLKVKAAELAGAAGCLIYSDPKEDGFLKGEVYPNGRFMPADGVQRGSVGPSWVLGDPLSPGFASLPNEPKRIPKEDSPGLDKIPSLPLAWRDAQHLLQALKGHGQKLTEDGWVGGVPEVEEWWTGDDKAPVVNLVNEQDEVDRRPIFNVLGVIDGIEQNEHPVIVGNHYDAWCYGATDPGSGTAVLVEMLRVFGALKARGWRPRRSLVFAAWDGAAYNRVGSTEYVEARGDELRRHAFAYVNVAAAVAGDTFAAAASPVYRSVLARVLKRVGDPSKGKSLFQLWEEGGGRLGGLGAGGDYVAFQDIVGVAALDLAFAGPRYPSHSCYDNFDWMSRVGDPGFLYHKLMGEVLSLMILELVDEPLFPFDLEAYAAAIPSYIRDLEQHAASHATSSPHPTLNFQALNDAAAVFAANAKEFHEWGRTWQRAVDVRGGREDQVLMAQRLRHNRRLAKFEADLLDLGGVSSPPSFFLFYCGC